MAKRFTDSDKWKNPWFRELDETYRWLWLYILDNCDAAGIWRIDFRLASYCIGKKINTREVEDYFENKIVLIDHDKWFIPSFIEFQYGTLKEESRPHLSVIKILQKNGINSKTLTLLKEYPKGIQTLKDKEQDKDKDQDKEKDKEKGGEAFASDADREEVYKRYPKKVGKTDGLAKLKKRCPLKKDLDRFGQAMDAYVASCKATDTFLKQFDTLANSKWEDWLDPETGTTTLPTEQARRFEEMARRFAEEDASA